MTFTSITLLTGP